MTDPALYRTEPPPSIPQTAADGGAQLWLDRAQHLHRLLADMGARAATPTPAMPCRRIDDDDLALLAASRHTLARAGIAVEQADAAYRVELARHKMLAQEIAERAGITAGQAILADGTIGAAPSPGGPADGGPASA